MKNILFITLILAVLVLGSVIIYNNMEDLKYKEEPKAKMLVGKICVELDETQSQFRAKQELWGKAFGFSYIECR